METLLEILLELITEPIIEGIFLAMSFFTKDSEKIDEERARTFVVFELLALLVMFVAGIVIACESEGESKTGKLLLITSVAVSVIQTILGIILNILKKKHNK